ncbi:MAG: hypothetical protein HXX12_04820 [Geothrix sp.]|uniref:hypothetical protein n=1 Tax=Geothrix sp. TaxID=1962974 RepID=UPI0017B77B26|nr:hypothetical protein [Geothrix sp.]NWJ40278.1 hypothetical protein [Geothrix sp.]WIL21717.1 MAG: hypothetical protein QOZ81_000987 [Geothrix sp.]
MSKAFSPLSLGVGFTALLALVPGLGLGSKAPKREASPTAKVEAAKKDRKVEAVGALLDQCLKDRPQAAASTVGVTILTLPDPQRTNMSLWFDLRLNAVQRAFKADDFLPRAFYLPWESKGREEGGAGISSEFAESGPGLIWFARGGATPAYHALFIVGESQSLGLNREAFRQALQLASLVPAPKGERRLSILGPQFSGSLSSLGAALEAHFKDPAAPDIRIQGTTTLDPNGVKILRTAIGSVEPRRLQLSPWICNLSGPSKDRLLDWYVAEAGWPQDASRIALFTESNTIYARDGVGARMTQILFPMGLSRLRSERQAMEHNLAKGGDSQELVLPSTLLGPAEDDSLRVLDTVPQYSPDTVRNTELTLAGTILSLARRGYTHVGISASDPQDLLFLAERIRAYHPSCTLFTTSGNHALFAHPNHSQAMDGMVLFGGYAVTDAVRVLSLKKGDLESPVRFTSEGEYATYYATMLLLDPTRADDPERRYWGKQGLVSIVKGGSIWPLRHGGLEVTRDGAEVWDQDVEARYREVATQSKDLVQYVHSRLRQLALLVFSLGLASVLVFLRPLHQVAAIPVGEPGLRAYRYLGSGAVLALAVLTFLAMGYLLPLAVLRGNPGHDPYLWMSVLIWVVVLLATGWSLRGLVGGWLAILLLLIALLPAVAILIWGPTHLLVFIPAYLRFSSPGRGVSLIPSMLLLAGGVALLLRTWFDVRRQNQDAFWPEPIGITERKVLVMRHLRGLHFQPWTLGIAMALVGFQLIMPGGLIRPLMEVQGITLVVVAAAAALFTASAFLFWQFHQGWKELRGVLEVLNMSSYRAAFAEVGALIEWKAMTALGRGMSTRRSSLRGREILQAQQAWVSRILPTFAGCLGALTDLEKKISRSRRNLGEYENWRNRLAIAHQMTACGDGLAAACAKDPAAAAAHQAEVDVFCALRAVHFIRQAFLVLRAQLIGSLGTMILLILGVGAFDFQPKSDVLILLSAALLGMALWVTLAILAMERDPLLCLMEGTQPGEVQFSLGLVENGFRFVVVPLLLLLATLNPSFGGVVMQVFNPLMHLLK